jgi:hypothetical protein
VHVYLGYVVLNDAGEADVHVHGDDYTHGEVHGQVQDGGAQDHGNLRTRPTCERTRPKHVSISELQSM